MYYVCRAPANAASVHHRSRRRPALARESQLRCPQAPHGCCPLTDQSINQFGFRWFPVLGDQATYAHDSHSHVTTSAHSPQPLPCAPTTTGPAPASPPSCARPPRPGTASMKAFGRALSSGISPRPLLLG